VILVQEPVSSPGAGAPVQSEVQVEEVYGGVCFAVSPGSASIQNTPALVTVGIYVAEYLKSVPGWSVRDPADPASAQQDDYLFLRSFACLLPPGNPSSATLPTIPSQIQRPEIRIGIPAPEIIGSGEALMLTISMGSGVNTLLAFANVRSRITRAA